jgi:hypothetical protein
MNLCPCSESDEEEELCITSEEEGKGGKDDKDDMDTASKYAPLASVHHPLLSDVKDP